MNIKTVKLLGTAFLFVSLTACSQKGKNAPQEVQSAFAKKFPQAKNVKWDKENEKEWEAEFKLKSMEYSANFTTDGTWKETEHEIKSSEIPAKVKNTLDQSYAGYDIEESEISETSEGMVYEFELEKGESVMEVAISKAGEVVGKEIKKENDEENGEEYDEEDND